MMRRRVRARLTAPFLRSVRLSEEKPFDGSVYPFSIRTIAAGSFRIDFTRPVTILVGPNGSGKSTILEAIASLCGFGRFGGSRNYNVGAGHDDASGWELARHLKAAWLPKVARGFFVRAETLFAFISQVDALGVAPRVYGVDSLEHVSHGEAFLKLFNAQLDGGGVYIFDEPEAALSPSRQIEFLRMIRTQELNEDSQFIIATHSPMVMAYPGATVLHLTDAGLVEKPFLATEHFRLLREFYADPEGFMDALFCDIQPD
jgi:predicted ATPase